MSEPGSALPPLRVCLLSGGASRRMGQDKALLPHPEGGCWLERTLRLLAALRVPITLLSRHPEHLERARRWAELAAALEPVAAAEPAAAAPTGPDLPPLEALAEPPPWEGPLLALGRLARRYPKERLLLCPVDMPWLTLEALQLLRRAVDAEPHGLLLAHDGERSQPLLMALPLAPALRQDLEQVLETGERRLQGWLVRHPYRELRLNPQALRNVNRPEQWQPARSGSPR